MKVKYLLLATIVLLTSIISCSDDEKYSFESTSLRFSSTFSDQSQVNQRASGNSWNEGDAIGVFMKTGAGLTNIIGGANNQKHTTATTTGSEFLPADPIANAIYYPTSGYVDFIAYYPYVNSLTNFIYKVDVTNQQVQENIDLLYSNDATGKSTGDQVILGFKHKLTKVVFNLTSIDANVDLTDVAVSIDAMPVTADFDLGMGTLAVTGSPTAINMKAAVSPSDVLKAYAEGIVIPTEVGTRFFYFTFKCNGTTVTHKWDASGQSFDKGKKNIYNVQLGKDGVLIKPSSTIEDWGAGSSEEIIIDLGGDSESLTGITLKWDNEGQEMDGFGFAEAYWANYLFANEKRDEVLNLLLGESGLRCNIVRGEIFPSYGIGKGIPNDFQIDANTNISPSDSYFDLLDASDGDVKAEYSRRGQLWLSKEAKFKYGVEKLIFSVWSPPTFLKDNGSLSKGRLETVFYPDFAKFIAEFCTAYNSLGLNVYAVSPANEPEYPAEWNSCKWTSKELGKFISQDLYPTLRANNLDTKIYFGENAQWTQVRIVIVNLDGSKKFVESVLSNNPEIAGMNTIGAGHGYTHPTTKAEVSIESWPKAEAAGLKVWLTEVSMSKDSDFGFNDALGWAKTFHKYLAVANTSAIVWWGGAIRNGAAESLISLTEDRKGYEIADRYYTFGNFSRYIKSGSKRISVNKGSEIPNDLLVSAYKKGDEFVAVAVNTLDNAYTEEFVVEGKTIKNMKCIITDENNKWKEEVMTRNSKGKYSFSVPAKSVVTFIGNTN